MTATKKFRHNDHDENMARIPVPCDVETGILTELDVARARRQYGPVDNSYVDGIMAALDNFEPPWSTAKVSDLVGSYGHLTVVK